MKEYIKNMVRELTEKSIIDISVIPDIDLYIDQVTTFIEDRLSAYKINEYDKVLTKTMINNYTKAKLIDPPIKKKYPKKSIETLIMIFHMKYILSIENIRVLTDSLSEIDISNIYKTFTDIQKNEEKRILSEIENSNFSEKELEVVKAVCALTEGAVVRKKLAEKLIAKYLDKNGILSRIPQN